MKLEQMESEFKNLREVAAFLVSEGWQVSERTVYNHGKEGRIRPNAEGLYTIKAVNKYAAVHLERKETGLKLGDEELQKKKTMAEIAYRTEQAKLAQIKRMAEEGRYIPREDAELKMAQMMALVETGMRQMEQARAAGYISLVGGDENKLADLIRALNEDHDELLNECATSREFEVTFE